MRCIKSIWTYVRAWPTWEESYTVGPQLYHETTPFCSATGFFSPDTLSKRTGAPKCRKITPRTTGFTERLHREASMDSKKGKMHAEGFEPSSD